MSDRVIDYDLLNEWGPWVTDLISDLGHGAIIADLTHSKPAYVEDAASWLYARFGRAELLIRVAEGLRTCGVRLYHGTRLTAEVLALIESEGLRPLRLSDRALGIAALLSSHARWSEVASALPEAIERFGVGACAGLREDGCVHACFSRSGLLSGCDHYLDYGAEVDTHICYHLFGDDSAQALLHDLQTPYLISFVVPFDLAARSSHCFGELPAGRVILAEKLVEAWAYRQAHPGFEITTQGDCWAAKVDGEVPPDQLRFEAVDAAILGSKVRK